MIRRFVWIIGALAALVAMWFGTLAPAAAAEGRPVRAEFGYTYDSGHNPAVSTDTTTERGPPSSYDHNTTPYGAVDRWSAGASARLDATTPRSTYNCDHSAQFVRIARIEETIEEVARVGDRDFVVVDRDGVAANGAGDLGRVLSHTDLNPSQLSNFTRYAKKLPAGAEPTIITRGADGAVQLSTKVPGRVPGSYATYDKVVDATGTTIGYTKTTVAPDGTIVHIKDKLLP